MENAFTRAEELAAAIKDYADARLDEIKLSTAEKTSAIAANLLAGIIVLAVFALFVSFAGIALALLLAAWLGKMWIGFLLVACFYLLLGIIVWAARGRLIRLPLMNAMIRQLFKMHEDEED